MKLKIVSLIAALLFMSACGYTPQGNALRQAVSQGGAQAFDEGLVNAEFFVCSAASVGSVMRRYAVSVEKANAWKGLCKAASADGVDILLSP